MDTPLVKILLIAAAIAITVGVTVLAWSIFNEGSSEVSTDGADRAIAAEPGTRADGVRSNVNNERACEALGNAHWVQVGTDTEDDGELKTGFVTQDNDAGDAISGTNDHLVDHPATQVDEGESHCAVGQDLRSTTRGLVKRVRLYTGANAATTGTWKTYRLVK